MSSPAPIRLGPFHLSGRLVAGGFGVVWRGEHEGEGLPVAAKVMTGARVRRARYAEAFRNEVRAAAGLDHPGIVAVYDYGEVDEAAAAASGHALAAGSPYLVMELAEHGSLADRPGPYPWPVVKGVLQSLLASLAYAHARGIVHRDMKPGNVLVSGAAHRPLLKLADFGIAFPMHAEVDDDESSAATGTPRYMAPEQLRSAWRDFGPWTDLYGLACVAWQLLTGSPPFVRPGPLALMMAHLKDPVPPLSPTLGAPAGVEDWLRALLEKDPTRRPRSAADAARALDALPGLAAPLPLGEPGPAAASLEPTLDVVAGDDPTLVETTRPTFEVSAGDAEPETTVPLLPMRAGPMPPWRRDTPLVPPAALRDAGLGLFGLRGVPLVGREAERDALWAALRGACDTGLPGVIVLEGAAGTGKTRLGSWLGERAHEVGAARLLHAHHAAQPGPGDGLTPMLARALRTAGLNGDALVERVARALEAPPADPLVAAVAALLAGEVTDDTSISVRLQTAEERGVVVRRALGRLAVERALVVLLDDVVWAPDTLGFVEQAMATQHPAPFPVLFVLTARSEALPERPAAAARLEGLARPPRGRRLELGPLPADHQLTLVRELLGLEGALAARVAERAAGNLSSPCRSSATGSSAASSCGASRGIGWPTGPTPSCPPTCRPPGTRGSIGCWRIDLRATAWPSSSRRRWAPRPIPRSGRRCARGRTPTRRRSSWTRCCRCGWRGRPTRAPSAGASRRACSARRCCAARAGPAAPPPTTCAAPRCWPRPATAAAPTAPSGWADICWPPAIRRPRCAPCSRRRAGTSRRAPARGRSCAWPSARAR